MTKPKTLDPPRHSFAYIEAMDKKKAEGFIEGLKKAYELAEDLKRFKGAVTLYDVQQDIKKEIERRQSQ